jgi:hypothetical protein
MPDALTNVTEFIIKPSAPFAAGVILFGVVWGFFKGVESVLTDQTKLEIAVWLLGVKVGQKVEPWPDTFAKMFDRVFGTKHLSWKCFWRSCIASSAIFLVAFTIRDIQHRGGVPIADRMKITLEDSLLTLGGLILVNVVTDYPSLLESRFVLWLMRSYHEGFLASISLIVIDGLFTSYLGLVGTLLSLAAFGGSSETIRHQTLFFLAGLSHPLRTAALILPLIAARRDWIFFFPIFFTSIWLWLYAGSGFLLKAARRFDLGFDWFNRKFDIEKKPLQSIGLVAGALVAVVYWAAVIVGRWV